MLSTSRGKYVIASCQPEDARSALTNWLTTGALRISDAASIKITRIEFAYIPFCEVRCDYVAEWSVDIGEVNQGALSVACTAGSRIGRHDDRFEGIDRAVANRQRTTIRDPTFLAISSSIARRTEQDTTYPNAGERRRKS